MGKNKNSKKAGSEQELKSDAYPYSALAGDLACRDAVFCLNEDGILLYANGITEKRFRRTDKEELTAESIGEMMSLSNGERWDWPEIWERLKTEGSLHLNGKYCRVSDRCHPMELTLVLTDDPGHPLVVGSMQDTTEKEGLIDSLNLARDRANKYFQLGGLIYLVLTPEGEVMDINAFGSEMLGQQRKDIVGMSWIETFVPQKDQAKLNAVFDKVISGSDMYLKYENRIIAKGGSERIIEWHNTVLKDEQGGILAVLSAGADMTERIAAEHKSKELDALKNTFIQVVSHQVRTPLNSIRWSLETLMSEDLGKLTDSQRDFLKVVYSAETEILERLNEMLTALDISENRIVFSKGEFDLEAIWTSVMVETQRRSKLKDITLQYEREGEGFGVSGDAEKIRAVMSNLADNAIEYTHEGGRVRVVVSKLDDKVRFEVHDTGIGIPQPEQGRVFERFFRATNALLAKPDSTGLGLAICKYYIEQHGGQIGFDSQEGQGSDFWFELPISA